MQATARIHRRVSKVARGWHALRSNVGQALTEFAMVLPLLALIFMGVLDLGRAYHTEVAASNAARVGLIYAQEVASPRMLDCTPGTTCYFITVGDIISKVKGEAQGGIDPSQMQVGVCLQHDATCPVTDTSEAVASDELITVSVSVPFTPITPFVHLNTIGGSVSGRTFPFEPVGPTMTAAAITATATATPTSTATITATVTPTVTPTPQPIPTITSGPTARTTGHTATIKWYTNISSNNYIWVYVPGTGFVQYQASSGTIASISFSTHAPPNLNSGTYQYYVQSSTTGGSTYSPSDNQSCVSSGDCWSFSL